MSLRDRMSIRILLMSAVARMMGALIVIAFLWGGYFLVTSGAG